MAFTTVEVVYYAVLWLLSFLAGISRTLRDHTYKRIGDCIATGMVGGFYGFATVSILSYYGPHIAAFGWGYLGVAIAVGALGKEQDRVMRWVLTKFLGKFIDDEEPKP